MYKDQMYKVFKRLFHDDCITYIYDDKTKIRIDLCHSCTEHTNFETFFESLNLLQVLKEEISDTFVKVAVHYEVYEPSVFGGTRNMSCVLHGIVGRNITKLYFPPVNLKHITKIEIEIDPTMVKIE